MANTKITNHIVDSTVITGQSAVTVADGDYILVADASDSNALKKVLASDLIQSSEEISDIVGAMVSSNTESGITVAYEDSDNTLDFTIGTLNQNTTGSAATLTTARTIHGVSFDGSANIDLSEVISDTVGAMFSSNTETNITVTYQDSDNTIDLVVDAAQPNVTSLGTLTALDVDNININGNTIKSTDSDGDLIFGGNDGGSAITALTLDMSDAGKATFNNAVIASGISQFADVNIPDNNAIRFGNSQDLQTYHNGTNSYIDNSTGDLYLRTVNNFRVTDTSNNKMILCQDGGETQLYHNGTEKLNTDANGIEVQGKVVCSTSARIGQVALTSSSNAVAWDAAAAANAYHVTTENTTFSAPSNSAEGAIISVEIAQGGTARTIAWNTVFEFAASTAPTITATANKTDILAFRYNGSVWQEIGRVQNMAQT